MILPKTERMWNKGVAFTELETKEYALQGCKFAGRCPSVMDICRHQDPTDIIVDERIVKCHLYNS